MTASASFIEAFQAHGASLAGSDVPWLQSRRRRALDRFAAQGWPTPKIDAWRHTSLAYLEQQSFSLGGSGRSVTVEAAAIRDAYDGYWLTFVDGRHVPALSNLEGLPQGVRLEPLARVLGQRSGELESRYGSDSDGATTAALNLALADDGLCLVIGANVDVDRPIHVLFMSASPGSASFVRNFVVLESGASATLVEHYAGAGAGVSLSSSVLRIDMGAGARLEHLRLQREAPEAFHLAAIDVEQQRGSRYVSHSISLGARMARHDIATRFSGEHCEALLNGLYCADGQRHVDHHTSIDHAQPNGTSREYYRGILADTSHGVFAGRIHVAPGADGTDAVQRSDSLLLSRIARSDARPELEIYADAVKCAHGATVGQLDEDSLFYLRSRGVGELQARGILIDAFASQAIDRIKDAVLRNGVRRALRQVMPAGAQFLEEERA